MGVQTAISLVEYLHTSYDGLDREFRDGEVVERTMPAYSHGECQLRLGIFFMALREPLKLYPSSEIRMRLSGRRVIIADIAVFHPSKPKEVPDALPLIAIEIQSPGDRLSEVRAKLEEYREWGVPHVWLVDPGCLNVLGVRPVLRKTAPLADARGSARALKSIPTFRAATVRKRYTVFGMTDFRWNPQNG